METQSINQLSVLRTPSDYRSDGRSHIFPSQASLDWFIRKNKSKLLNSGAILAPTGRKLIDTHIFDQLVLEIGSEVALELQR